jgi:hypothetical protein
LTRGMPPFFFSESNQSGTVVPDLFMNFVN